MGSINNVIRGWCASAPEMLDQPLVLTYARGVGFAHCPGLIDTSTIHAQAGHRMWGSAFPQSLDAAVSEVQQILKIIKNGNKLQITAAMP